MRSILYIFSILIIFSCSGKEDRTLPTERGLIESVYSSVVVQPDSLYQVYAIVAGILDNNLVEEGNRVLKDQAIVQIINNTYKLTAENARLSMDLAKENYSGRSAILNNIKDEIASAKLTFKNDSVNFFRQKNLWSQRIGSEIEYNAKKLKYQLSQNKLQLLESKYAQTQNELITKAKQAQNTYETSLIKTKDFTVKSKIHGKVYALYKEPGEIVTTMEPLASVGSATDFVIEMLVDEVDIVRIAVHQDVLIRLDAYNTTVFKGKVSKIYPKKDERNQTFKVEAVFNKVPEILYPGLSGEANIIIAKKNNALTIPKAYLIDNNKVKTDDGITTITTGLQNMEYIEVLSGIGKDTYIYKRE